MSSFTKSLLLVFCLSPIMLFADGSNCDLETGGGIASIMEGCQPNGTVGGNLEDVQAIKERIKKALITLISIGSLVAVAIMVYAGFQYTTVYEDDAKIKKAKQTAIAALVGLLIMIFTFPFVDMIVTFIYEIGK